MMFSDETYLSSVLEPSILYVDPGFSYDTDKGSYALDSDSPCIDAGSGPDDEDGTPNDIGCFGGEHSEWWRDFPWPLD